MKQEHDIISIKSYMWITLPLFSVQHQQVGVLANIKPRVRILLEC